MEINFSSDNRIVNWKYENKSYSYVVEGIIFATESNDMIFLEIYENKTFSYRFINLNGKDILWYDENGNLKLFDSNDTMNIDNFKNELNSLRNQYVHEGYYLPNNQFAVNGKGKVFLYHKTMDYNWLLRIVKVFKFGVYKILYTKVLDLEIDEGELKSAVKCWF